MVSTISSSLPLFSLGQRRISLGNPTFSSSQGLAHNLLYKQLEKEIESEVSDYGPDTVDRLSSVPSGSSAQLGLSLVWLCTLEHRRGSAAGRCCSAPDRPALKGSRTYS